MRDAHTLDQQQDTRAIWQRATRALVVLTVDPAGLGGLWLRARSGPVRDRFVTALAALPLPLRKLHPAIGDDALFGGLDLAATLADGRPQRSRGLMAEPTALVLTMAERCPAGLAARLAAALDTGPGHTLIALDEGAEPSEAAPETVTDRLAFHVDLDGLSLADTTVPDPDIAAIADAQARLPGIRLPPELLTDIPLLSARLGIAGLRAPLLALRAARALAALDGRDTVSPDHLAEAAALVLAARATVMPEAAPPEAEDSPPEPQQPEPPAEQDTQDSDGDDDSPQTLPAELLLEAVAAALPPDLLARLAAQKARRNAQPGAGTGAKRKGSRRGRPLPSRAGRLDGTSRLDLVATLRAAAPWQAMRREQARVPRMLHVRAEDIRLKRYEDRADRLLIFTVDASGSAALARLAEAKGAVELLLAEAYARRDHVALVAFRGATAEILLPPTRSLVQTKRRLSQLPGGGGTPLAAGLQAAMTLAEQAKGRGMTPTLCLLTDGRANIALDGSASRTQAAEDATRIARAARATGLPALVIDMSKRPQPGLRALAETLAAPYVPLPRADAHGLSRVVSGALADD